MTAKRNVEGLRQNAQKKRQATLEKVEQGIRQLIKEGRAITFHTVAQAADVSKAFLYKEPEIKERIEQLREQSIKKQPEFKQRASDASKDAMIQTLRQRVKRLEVEVRDLRKQNEVAYGQVVEVNSLRQQIGRMQAENDRLCQSASLTQSQASVSRVSSLEDKMMALGVQLNSTIRRVVQEAPQQVIEMAIEALKEAAKQGRLENPSGFFYKAVTDAWKPNEDSIQSNGKDVFNEWGGIAKANGLVVASTVNNGVLQVMTSDQEWVNFDAMLETYPLEWFQK